MLVSLSKGRLVNLPFLFSVLPSLLFYIDIFGRQWVPVHDTFQLTNIAYFVFNEYVQNGALPLWYPHINFGVDTNWYLAISIGPSLAFLLPFAKALGNASFLTFYYLSLFLDELILLVGSYMLCRLIFKSAFTAVFVTNALGGSTLWYGQVWWNFHLYYLLPLSMYFMVKGCRESSLWKIMLSGTILVISSFGGLPYFPIVQGLTFVILVAVGAWAYRFDLRVAVRQVALAELGVFILLGVSAVSYLLLLTHGVHHINYNVGRQEGNIISPEDFLTYGGSIGLSKFSELFTGTSWSLDVNIYAGILIFCFALFGLLWSPSRQQLPFLLAGIVLTLFSLGKESFVAPLLYHLPAVSYYRHIGLVLPIIKVMLIILAGFGFDALLERLNPEKQIEKQNQDVGGAARANLVLLGSMLIVFVALSVITTLTIRRGHIWTFNVMPAGSPDVNRFLDRSEFLSRIAVVGFLYGASVFLFSMLTVRGRALGSAATYALLGLHLVDVYSYRSSHYHGNMLKIDGEYHKLFYFRPTDFVAYRSQDYFDSEHFSKMAPFLPSAQAMDRDWFNECIKSNGQACRFPEGTRHGNYYNTVEPFLGLDPCRSIFRVDFWLPGIDKVYRAQMGMALDDLKVIPPGLKTRDIAFPRTDEEFNKIIGCRFPKIQFFRDVTTVENDQAITQLIRDKKYTGDLLLVSRKSYDRHNAQRLTSWGAMRKFQHQSNRPSEIRRKSRGTEKTGETPASPRFSLQSNLRIIGEVKVERFSANELKVRVTTPKDQKSYWLYYADAWHPFWRAFVDYQEVPILNANLGFKAVEIPSGEVMLEFTYSSLMLKTIVIGVFTLLGVFMLAILGQAVRLLIGHG